MAIDQKDFFERLERVFTGDFVKPNELKQVADTFIEFITEFAKKIDKNVIDSSSNIENMKVELASFKREKENLFRMISDTKGELQMSSDKSFSEVREKMEKILGDMSLFSGTDSLKDEFDESLVSLAKKFEGFLKDSSPEIVRNKLESLEGEERLKIEAIKDLREELDELKKKLTGIAKGSGSSTIAYSRGQIVLYDISSQLNGVLKTFSLPAFWKVLTVQASSFPNAFRPTVDYTVDAAAMTITFTSEIEASSTLATGQTITVLYAEV